MLPETPQRVPAHTSDEVNRWIAQRTAASVDWHARHPDHIGPRLHQLDREWDMERTLEANAATLALTGTLLGLFLDRRFLAVDGAHLSTVSGPPGDHCLTEQRYIAARAAFVTLSGPISASFSSSNTRVSFVRARLTRLLIVPTAHPQIAAASS
jgi:hypothetical protein